MFEFDSTSFIVDSNDFRTIFLTNFVSIVVLCQIFSLEMFRRRSICLVTILTLTSAFFLSEIFLRFLPKILQQQTNSFGSSILIGIFIGFTFDKILRFFQIQNEKVVAFLYFFSDFLYHLTNFGQIFHSMFHFVGGFAVLIQNDLTTIKVK